MDAAEIIRKLKDSNIYAECPCGGEFNFSDAILFDGTKPFPEEAFKIQQQLKEKLNERLAELKNREKLATKQAQATTKAVNVGKNLEKVLPTLADFKWELPDTRYLGDPIDLITFNGLSANNVQSISFIEVKSGNARLNGHQKSIKEAIGSKRISYKVLK